MGAMSEYLIWVGEKMEKEHPNRSWEEIMAYATSHELPECYSFENYLKGENHGKSRYSASEIGSDEHVSGKSQMAVESTPDADQSGVCDILSNEETRGTNKRRELSNDDRGRYETDRIFFRPWPW